MDSNTPNPPSSGSPAPRRPGTESVLTLVGGVLAGVGSVFGATHSIVVTLIAVITAVVLTAMLLAIRR